MRSRFISGLVLVAMFIAYVAPAPTSAAVLTDAQIQAITSLAASFGVDASVVSRIESVLKGNTVTGGASSTSSGVTEPVHPVVPNVPKEWRHMICKRLLEAQIFPTFGTQSTFAQDIQDFLASEGFFNASTTGFFGKLTERALGDWQVEHGLVIAGNVAQGWGVFGPRTREIINTWCKGETIPPTPPTCGTDAKPVCALKQVQCITTPCNLVPTTYENRCTAFADNAKVMYEGACKEAPQPFVPDASCKTWYDGCNNCARQTLDGPPVCTLRACVWQAPGYCTAHFDNSVPDNKPPVISEFSGPTTLTVNETGTWTISASDPENGTLSYRVYWGDEGVDRMLSSAVAFTEAFVQTSTFTHTYAKAGTYAVIIIVRDDQGKMGYMSTKVKVEEDIAVYCTQEYTPVCGQPPEPACRHASPACMMPTPGPKTYSNTCMMKAAGATLLYTGQCKTDAVACTQEAKLCPDGSYVGRTGPNCEFVCPSSTVAGCVYKGINFPDGTYFSKSPNSAQCKVLGGVYCQVIAIRLLTPLPYIQCKASKWIQYVYQYPEGMIENGEVNPETYPYLLATTTAAAASCTAGTTTYANGQSLPTLTWCQQQGGCPVGLTYSSAVTCSNGQWVSSSSQTISANSSCTYNGQTYVNGQTIPGRCPIGPGGLLAGGACSGPQLCHNGQWVAATTQTTSVSVGALCSGASGTYSHGTTLGGQTITGGPFTRTVVWPAYMCTNGVWKCSEWCWAGTENKAYTYKPPAGAAYGTLEEVAQ